ncbi:tryptophan 7-halogenase [Pseudoalteromonas phenolica]|uniref:tryptophan 7-halogenase n=1 Tax=Pseudoalteromonas phenolica TaxID=161398 RepID=UPI003BAAEA52
MRLKPHLNKSYSVVLIDSPDIPTVGVGEGTVPVIKDTLKYFGISESEFIKQCDVSFKQSIKFVDWEYTPGTTEKKLLSPWVRFSKAKAF